MFWYIIIDNAIWILLKAADISYRWALGLWSNYEFSTSRSTFKSQSNISSLNWTCSASEGSIAKVDPIDNSVWYSHVRKTRQTCLLNWRHFVFFSFWGNKGKNDFTDGTRSPAWKGGRWCKENIWLFEEERRRHGATEMKSQ